MVGEKWEKRGKEAKRGNVSVRPSVYAAKKALRDHTENVVRSLSGRLNVSKRNGLQGENTLAFAIEVTELQEKGEVKDRMEKERPLYTISERFRGLSVGQEVPASNSREERRSRRNSSYRGHYIPHLSTSALLLRSRRSCRQRPANRGRGVVWES